MSDNSSDMAFVNMCPRCGKPYYIFAEDEEDIISKVCCCPPQEATWTEPYRHGSASHVGWICPRCLRANSPWKGQCDCSPPGDSSLAPAWWSWTLR